ncbi:MerR family transcriptional regulator [Streptomyces sp. NRRL F-5126]|uniref:MerR family transcriptional regulator n=1 Tax=Streptomyces sp. NRRL F-5126 TaxID=1463857 RepID=UPI00068D15A8|nr:MerR family transcriptional regulator [Streptomyces sp. NRRL F-5126]
MGRRDAQSTGGDAADADGPVPIDEAARAFGIRASALRYYERRGLLEPATQRGGRRWYTPAALHRLAVITFWQRSGLMSLDQIAALLDNSTEPGRWRHVVTERRAALAEQIERMSAARDTLDHLLICPRDHFPYECPYFEETVWQPQEQRLREARDARR